MLRRLHRQQLPWCWCKARRHGTGWQGFFSGLDRLVAGLSAKGRPSGGAGSLLDDTVVVVMSEMARTPGLNADGGRDHWPWTSAILIGGAVRGGRVVGGYDGGYRGLGVDLIDGTGVAALPAPTPADLGATLFALANLDPGALGPGTRVIGGIL